MTVTITKYDRPIHFRDSMQRGAFRHFDHDHFFASTSTGTEVRDLFTYDSPLGILGHAANTLFVDRHMRKLLETRNQLIKSVAETSDAKTYLSNTETA